MSRQRTDLDTETINRLRNYVLNVYKKTGSLDVIYRLFEESFDSRVPQVRGELAEVFLEIKVQEFVKKHKGVIYVKNLVIPTITNRTTELDLLIASKKKIIIFESKSYNGKKVLTKEGTMKTRYSEIDVYGQNKWHLQKLDDYFKKLRYSDRQCYKLVLFNFSKGDIEDRREDKWKRLFPVIDTTNIDDLLESELLGGEDKWNIKGVYKVLSFLNQKRSELLEQHLNK